MSTVVIVQGHPDKSEPHFCHALADAYARGAQAAGHAVLRLELARMDIPFLPSQKEQETGTVNADIAGAQDALRRADHIAFVYPLWLGGMPALVKAFLEQVLRPGFAYAPTGGPFKGALLKGRSARVIVTMGMPGWFYRIFYGAHSLKALKVGILRFVGIKPVRETIIGMVAAESCDHAAWLARVEELGRRAIA